MRLNSFPAVGLKPDAADCPLDFRLVSSIQEIPIQTWNQLSAPRGILWQWRHFELMERSKIGPDGFEYLICYQGDDLVAILPLFWFKRFPLEPAHAFWGAVVNRARKFIPSLLTLGVIFCGHPLDQGSAIVRQGYRLEFSPELLRRITERARAHHLNFTIHKDVAVAVLESSYRDYAAANHFTVPALPGAMVSFGSPNWADYWAQLKRKPRSNLRRKLRQVAAHPGLRLCEVDDVSPLVDEMERLYRLTLSRSRVRLDELNAGYFSGLAKLAAPRARILACYQDEKLVGFAMVLLEPPGACFFRVGLEYSHPLRAAIYFSLHLEGLRLACESGCEELDLCPTTYQPKIEMGAALHRLVHVVHHRHRVGQWIGQATLPFLLRQHQRACDVPPAYLG